MDAVGYALASSLDAGFDEKSGAWSGALALVPTAREFFTLEHVDKMYYAMGGDSTNDNENQMYDPSTNTWTTKAVIPVKKYRHMSGVANGKIYVFAGLDGSTTRPVSTYEYDPVGNTWTLKANIPASRYDVQGASNNGIIYIIGGFDSANALTSTNYAYDPSTNTWTTKAACPTAKSSFGCAVVNNNVHTFAGWTGARTNIHEVYNISANTWSSKAVYPVSVNNLAGARVGDLVGGSGGHNGSSSIDSFYTYDTVANSWTSRTTGILACSNHSMASSPDGKESHVMGGDGTSDNQNRRYTVSKHEIKGIAALKGWLASV